MKNIFVCVCVCLRETNKERKKRQGHTGKEREKLILVEMPK